MNKFNRSMAKDEAIVFIQMMYAAAGLSIPNDEQAIDEWTSRLACIRSRYSQGEAVVCTHGSSAAFDHLPLPEAIVEYLVTRSGASILNLTNLPPMLMAFLLKSPKADQSSPRISHPPVNLLESGEYDRE
jgi:hypothetical protein